MLVIRTKLTNTCSKCTGSVWKVDSSLAVWGAGVTDIGYLECLPIKELNVYIYFSHKQ
jgi:hypothetical protein